MSSIDLLKKEKNIDFIEEGKLPMEAIKLALKHFIGDDANIKSDIFCLPRYWHSDCEGNNTHTTCNGLFFCGDRWQITVIK